jgi:triosephosphate isomerase (TIM)
MKPLIVANWKCNPKSLEEAKALFNEVKDTGAVICPPFIYLEALGANGGQDVSWAEGGAYTGEISANMLKDLRVEYVIVGHSERRKHQKETNETIVKKLKAALGAGLTPILCIDKISQIPANLDKRVIIAYEPLFAIGTGKACSPEKAEKMRLNINKAAKSNAVLYGGSVNSQNAKDYIKEAGFQGLLVGGASLKPQEFIDIVKNVC